MTNAIQKSASWRIAASLALMVFCAPVARGACLNWERYITRPNSSTLFEGKVGDQSIAVLLHLDPKTGRFDGVYGYADHPNTYSLTGNMLTRGRGLVLEAHDKQGSVMGYFSLLFFRPVYKSTNWNSYRKWYIDSCDTMTGIWRPSNGKNAQYVTLNTTGERQPSQKSAMSLNDATAYEMDEAIRNGNKEKFASLLHYPFCTASALGIEKVYTNPAKVIAEYKKIISYLSPDTPAFYMPHFVTDDSFMNGSVHFEDGKAALICLGHCPNPFENPCAGANETARHWVHEKQKSAGRRAVATLGPKTK